MHGPDSLTHITIAKHKTKQTVGDITDGIFELEKVLTSLQFSVDSKDTGSDKNRETKQL